MRLLSYFENPVSSHRSRVQDLSHAKRWCEHILDVNEAYKGNLNKVFAPAFHGCNTIA